MNKTLWRRATRTEIWRKLTALCLLALLVSTSGLAQQSATKRPLTHADYDSWRAIQGQSLSRDGKFVAYALVPQDGDGEVVVRNLATGAEWRHSRGAAPVNPPQRSPEGEPGPGPGGGFGQGPFAGRPFFTADSRFAVFQVLPAKAEVEKAKKRKEAAGRDAQNAMGIMDLSTGEVTRVDRVKSFQVPEEAAGFIAYSLEAKLKNAGPKIADLMRAPLRRRGAAEIPGERNTALILSFATWPIRARARFRMRSSIR